MAIRPKLLSSSRIQRGTKTMTDTEHDYSGISELIEVDKLE